MKFREGRIENFGDYAGAPGQCVVRLWNKRTGYNPHGDVHYCIDFESGDHGGADPKIVAEFVRYVREGGKIKTSVIAARNSVATGCAATESLRNGGKPVVISSVPDNLAAYFNENVQ